MANLLLAGIIERRPPPRHINMVLVRPNIFEKMSDHKFVKTFRLTKILANDLISKLTPYLPETKRKSALTAETRVSLFHISHIFLIRLVGIMYILYFIFVLYIIFLIIK